MKYEYKKVFSPATVRFESLPIGTVYNYRPADKVRYLKIDSGGCRNCFDLISNSVHTAVFNSECFVYDVRLVEL